MMYCEKCENPVTYDDKSARKCPHCGAKLRVRGLIVAFLLLCFVGCDPCKCEPSAEIKARAAELSTGFASLKTAVTEAEGRKVDRDGLVVELLKEQTTALAAIKSQVDSMEASLVKTEAVNAKEVIKSATEPQEAKRPNQSQPLLPVGTPPAVRSSAVKMSWNVEGNWNPTILETAKHLREDHGIIADGMTHQEMHDAHAAAHEGRPVAVKSSPVQFINRGTNCPGGVCPTRQTVRMRWRR